MYNKNYGKKMFGEKIYPAPERNLMNPVSLKIIGGKITDFMLRWVLTKERKIDEAKLT